MNSSSIIFRRLVVALATVGLVLLFDASGASAAPATTALPAAGLLAQEEDEPSDEPTDNSDSDDEDSDDEDSSDEDNESEEPSDEPTDEPTFTDPPTTDATDVTEMPTSDADADATSEAGNSLLGWILLGGGAACAAAAIAVYRRNRHIM